MKPGDLPQPSALIAYWRKLTENGEVTIARIEGPDGFHVVADSKGGAVFWEDAEGCYVMLSETDDDLGEPPSLMGRFVRDRMPVGP